MLEFYSKRDIQRILLASGKWKLHVFRPGEGPVQILYDLESDKGETTNVSDEYPDTVEQLEILAEKARKDLGDDVTGQAGENIRPIETLE